MFDVILGSTWLEMLKEHWEKYGLFSSEIWLGHSDTKMRYYRRIELDVKYKYSYEFDAKYGIQVLTPNSLFKLLTYILHVSLKTKQS